MSGFGMTRGDDQKFPAYDKERTQYYDAANPGWSWFNEVIWQTRQVTDPVEREQYILRAADGFEVSPSEIRAALKRQSFRLVERAQ